MKRLFLYYIIPLFCFVAVSCVDELNLNGYQNNTEELGGTMSLSLMVESADQRTRAIDLSPGAAVNIDKVWVGIYDKKTGLRIGGTNLGSRSSSAAANNYDDALETSLGNRLTASNVEILDAVPFVWYKKNAADEYVYGDTPGNYLYNDPSLLEEDGKWSDKRDLCVVSVANYDNPDEGLTINTSTGRKLFAVLCEADTWEDFKNIAIDCNSYGFTSGKPMLMGYLFKNTVKEYGEDIAGQLTFTKVNQFSPSSDAINLYPYGERTFGEGNNTLTINRDDLKFVHPTLNDDGKPDGLDIGDKYLIKLRRLRSKINIEINTPDPENITITSMQYAVFNSPKSVYLAQRRTNIFDYSDEIIEEEGKTKKFTDDAKLDKYSPNSADMVPNGYSRDDDTGIISWTTPSNIKSFSFDHFENKHWAVKDLTEDFDDDQKEDYYYTYDLYHAREQRDNKGIFTALTSSSSADESWNNNASYFILKIGILDKNKGQYSEVEYTIHEGYCNNKDGQEIEFEGDYDEFGNKIKNEKYTKWIEERVQDFSCVRNTNYTYLVTINSANDIYHQVTTSGWHANDQIGDIWEMKYQGGQNQIKLEDWEPKPGDCLIDEDVYISFPDIETNPLVDPNRLYTTVKPDDIAFRLIGDYEDNNGNLVPVDVCYNFSRGELDGFADLWQTPSVYTEYIVNNDFYKTPFEALKAFKDDEGFKQMMDNIILLVGDNKTEKTIYGYFSEMYDSDNKQIAGAKPATITGFKIKSNNYYGELSDSREHMRGFYIFDRERALLGGHRIVQDGFNWHDGILDDKNYKELEGWFHSGAFKDSKACKLYQIYAFEQLPKYILGKNYIMNYANGEEKIDENGKDIPYNDFNEGKGIELSANPDLAFRLIGVDGNDNPIDICYNFSMKDYPALSSYWPNAKSTMKEVAKGSLDSENINADLLNGLQILVNANEKISIKDFISRYDSNVTAYNAKFGFYVGKYVHEEVFDPEDYMRALYIFDKNAFKDASKVDKDDYLSCNFYAAEQYPAYDTRLKVIFDENSLIWDYEFVKLFSTKVYKRENNVIKSTPEATYNQDHWFGGRETTTEMHWKHWPGVTGYKIQIIDFDKEEIKKGIYEQLEITDAEARFKNYIETKPNGDEIFHCPFTTTRYSPGAYDVIITPYVDPSIVKNTPQPFTAEKALVIQEDQVSSVTTWNFSETPWNSLAIDDFDYNNPKPLEYNGLRLYHSSQGSNVFPSTQTGNSQYIRFGGNGVATKYNQDNCIEVYLHEPGDLIVTVSSNGGEKKDRDVYVYEEVTDKTTKINTEYLVSASASYTYKVNPPVNPDVPSTVPPSYIPSRYFIYCDKDAFFYKITFKRDR